MFLVSPSSGVAANERWVHIFYSLSGAVVCVSLHSRSLVRWQHFLPPSLRLVVLCFADVTTRAALPQKRQYYTIKRIQH